MIEKTRHQDAEIAVQIYRVFQASYRVEADLLGVEDFPPLSRTVEDFIISNTSFFGYFEGNELAAVIEIDELPDEIDICSLVVSPAHFRKGIAKKLLTFVKNNYSNMTLMVETGVDNHPAIQLYEKFGFIEQKRWRIPIGIEKVKFELQANM